MTKTYTLLFALKFIFFLACNSTNSASNKTVASTEKDTFPDLLSVQTEKLESLDTNPNATNKKPILLTVEPNLGNYQISLQWTPMVHPCEFCDTDNKLVGDAIATIKNTKTGNTITLPLKDFSFKNVDSTFHYRVNNRQEIVWYNVKPLTLNYEMLDDALHFQDLNFDGEPELIFWSQPYYLGEKWNKYYKEYYRDYHFYEIKSGETKALIEPPFDRLELSGGNRTRKTIFDHENKVIVNRAYMNCCSYTDYHYILNSKTDFELFREEHINTYSVETDTYNDSIFEYGRLVEVREHKRD